MKSNIHFTSHIFLNVVRKSERGVIFLEDIRGKREINIINEKERKIML